MDQQEKAGKTEQKELDRSAQGRPNLYTRPSSIDPIAVQGRSMHALRGSSIEPTVEDALDRSHGRSKLDRSHAEQASSIDPVLSQPFDPRSDDITAVRSTWCKPT
ncbi:unnamed protein product [Microthlaspi erraticum]|uniref:Uncharacterized protein n=1 Tax=Microthlaspi erraticum TaxID=1685480 RepID=A0A6D2K5Y2_9BRAS|nr:unnamed protein product [Microthlaspi erraticum]